MLEFAPASGCPRRIVKLYPTAIASLTGPSLLCTPPPGPQPAKTVTALFTSVFTASETCPTSKDYALGLKCIPHHPWKEVPGVSALDSHSAVLLGSPTELHGMSCALPQVAASFFIGGRQLGLTQEGAENMERNYHRLANVSDS